MGRAVVLALCSLLLPVPCTPLYPALQFGQQATAILMSSSLEDPLQLPTDYSSAQSQDVEYRSGRHADAIFTNRYRKVLGQISARKFLQTIMGKRVEPESETYIKRHLGIFEDTYKQDLAAIEREQSYRKQQLTSKA
ncbi:somatoliberin [Electrophorus electricus]|uniref:somatoliberin n=1 Tax=Electrophorus electricus TaxID=8005 RepID=UPI0015CFA1CA|nr:somatoliberin [Electrophorus electricus]